MLNSEIKFSRVWAMPDPNTFSIKPIAELLDRWLPTSSLIVDPFARNASRANVTNDLSPDTQADSHMDAVEFLNLCLESFGAGSFDAALLDPPYSPRQVTECYQNVGRKVGMAETQTARLYKQCKDRMTEMLKSGGIAVTCGWNSNGFGKGRGFLLKEVLLVPGGGAHNDYIVTVEVKK